MRVFGGSRRRSILARHTFYAHFFFYSTNLEYFHGFLPPVVVSGQANFPGGSVGGSLLLDPLPCPLSYLFSWREDKEAHSPLGEYVLLSSYGNFATFTGVAS